MLNIVCDIAFIKNMKKYSNISDFGARIKRFLVAVNLVYDYNLQCKLYRIYEARIFQIYRPNDTTKLTIADVYRHNPVQVDMRRNNTINTNTVRAE